MKHAIVLLYVLLVLALANIATTLLSFKKDPVSMQDRQTIIRGGIVFNTYCVLCHGENADGKGRLSEGKIPPPANLTASLLTDQMKEDIIRKLNTDSHSPPEIRVNGVIRNIDYYYEIFDIKPHNKLYLP